MAIKATRTVITLTEGDLVRLEEILIDEDAPGALGYLRDVIGEKVTCAQAESHRPTFEGGGGEVAAHYLQQPDGHPEVGETG
jgi:hypothetical protein